MTTAWRQASHPPTEASSPRTATKTQSGDWYQFVVFVFGPSLLALMLGARPGFLTAKGFVRPVDGFIHWDRISSYEFSDMKRGSTMKIHVERSRWSPFRPWHIHRPTTWRVAEATLPQVRTLLEEMVGPSGDAPPGTDMTHDDSASPEETGDPQS